MERQPLKYISEYESHTEDFTSPIVINIGNKTERVYKKIVTLEFVIRRYVPMMICKTYDIMYVELDGVHSDKTRLIRTVEVFYDTRKDHISPSLEQQHIITALASGDLSGNAADNMVDSLYSDCIILNKKSHFKKFLPKLYERILEIRSFHKTLQVSM